MNALVGFAARDSCSSKISKQTRLPGSCHSDSEGSKMVAVKSYRYRPGEGYVHKLTPIRSFHPIYLFVNDIGDSFNESNVNLVPGDISICPHCGGGL